MGAGGLAAAGVLYLTAYVRASTLDCPLACFSFGIYGFVKKLAPLGSLYGLTLETASVFPIALIYLLFVGSKVRAHSCMRGR